MPFTEPVMLRGTHVTLEPLAPAHAEGLALAAADGELWRLWYTRVPEAAGMAAEISRRLQLLEAGSMLPFAVRRNVDVANRRVEIGSTWTAASAQRTGVNTESKLLLLTHAFEHLHCIAVEFRTSFMNQQSRTAIARLGAKQDGILRNHQISADGIRRDTVVFSITDADWPAVRCHLQFKLAR
jgi:RimJ/RimL family protein N-acetyltransferase